jgi:hypothetical protein
MLNNRAIGGISLIWPLYLAGNIESIAPPSLRNWVISRLEYIGHTMGIEQAILLATLLKNRKGGIQWSGRAETEEVNGTDVDGWDEGSHTATVMEGEEVVASG